MNIDVLRREFQEILTLEERAEQFYSHYIDQIKDEEIKKTLNSIRDDEIMHIEIAKKLIDCIS
jgi:rubrerythrin